MYRGVLVTCIWGTSKNMDKINYMNETNYFECKFGLEIH